MTRDEARLTLQENFGLLSSEYPGRVTEALRVALETLNEDIHTSNLDEAAWQYGIENQEGIATQSEKVSAFKAGAEWMIERVISWLKENGHIYLYDAEVNRGEDHKVDLRISEKCFEDLRKAIKEE